MVRFRDMEFQSESSKSLQNLDVVQEDEMLSVENASLRERVSELEKKVQSQEDELMCLRSSTADLLRRLNILEETNNNDNRATSVQSSNRVPSSSADVFERLSSSPTKRSNFTQSSTNLRVYGSSSAFGNNSRQISPSPPATTPVGTNSRRITRDSAAKPVIVNISASGSHRGKQMRKWMSSADVKQNSSFCSHSVPVSNASVLNLSNSTSPPQTSSGTVSKAKSVSRQSISNLSTIGTSRRGAQIGFNYREPTFIPEQKVLVAYVKGRTVHVPTPSSVTELNPLRPTDPPHVSPQLEWIHGYRGKDSRNNLYELPTGEMVYFTGAVIILHNFDDGTQRFYRQHTSEIKCIAIHPSKLLVASGQTSRHSVEKKILTEHRTPICSPAELDNVLQTDQTQAHVRIWDSITLQTLHVIGVSELAFERGIACLAFSRSDGGSLLAVVDESYTHTLSVWNWVKGERLVDAKGANDQVFACEFHPLNKSLIVTHGKGHFNLWHFDGKSLEKKSIAFEGRDKPKLVLSVCFTESGGLISGDSNGTITLWDVQSQKILRQATKVHEGGVWAVCALSTNRLISGGKDRNLIEWNASDLSRLRGPVTLNEDAGIIRTLTQAKGSSILVGTTKNSILRGDLTLGFHNLVKAHGDELRALSVHPNCSVYLSGSMDGTVKLWDARSCRDTWSINVPDGVLTIDFHPSGNVFAVGTLGGMLIVYDTISRNPILSMNTGTSPVTALRYSPDGQIIVVANQDSPLFLFSVDDNHLQYQKVAEFPKTGSATTSIDWSKDSRLIRIATVDLENHIWDVSTMKAADSHLVRDCSWNTATYPLSYENVCIAMSVSGATAFARSNDDQLIAVALDNGAIRVYVNPANSIRAGYKEIFGHSIFISNIAFLETRLISIGAKDNAVFQWKL
ncbi:hypothetical protein AB6A40_003443 [Gnathostoma spinigerum]|uniref:HELP domain-containing protein n=1 Tax=Gnathostoma spinigerum TaxID=75299 RepID=A0ABD6EF41_9BILA